MLKSIGTVNMTTLTSRTCALKAWRRFRNANKQIMIALGEWERDKNSNVRVLNADVRKPAPVRFLVIDSEAAPSRYITHGFTNNRR